MRKLIILLSAALGSVAFTACSGTGGNNTDNDIETHGMDDRDSADMDMHGE